MFFFNPLQKISSFFSSNDEKIFDYKSIKQPSKYYKKKQEAPLVVLVLDGGGIRGILPVLALIDISKQLSQNLHYYIDIFGGTSTGGIIAVCLNLQMSLEEILNIYESAGQIMFKDQNNIVLNSLKPKYDNSEYVKMLNQILGKQRLSQVQKDLYLMSCNTIGEMKLFSSRDAKKDPEQDIELKYAVLATSAAPTFFPAVQYKQQYALVDGGVIRNNPATSVISDVVSNYGWDKTSKAIVISIGTGKVKGPLYDEIGSGYLYWAKAFPTINIASSSQTTHQEMEKMFPNNYIRVQWELDEEIELDKADPKSIQKLKNIYKQQYNQIKNKLQKIVQLLQQQN